MEWEYLTVSLLPRPDDGRFVAMVRDTEKREKEYMTLTAIGLQRWELVAVVAAQADLLAFFKRQKLYQV